MQIGVPHYSYERRRACGSGETRFIDEKKHFASDPSPEHAFLSLEKVDEWLSRTALK